MKRRYKVATIFATVKIQGSSEVPVNCREERGGDRNRTDEEKFCSLKNTSSAGFG
jgi:hypothetical protein